MNYADGIGDRIIKRKLTRRDFLWLMSATGAGVAGASLSGCATDPVSGKSVLVGLTPQQEIALDKNQSPFQFSEDYGAVKDPNLNRYVDSVGSKLAANSHRPNMPYSFRVVNANHVNAYAFPGGSIAVTRGLLVELENESELAGLLGHEVGHVSARHAAEQAGKTIIAQAALMSSAILASTQSSSLGNTLYGLGSFGAGALLSHYSRNNERESDSLGLSYMTETGYNPNGMLGLTDVLRKQNKSQPSSLETMFATHPPSEERYRSTEKAIAKRYTSLTDRPLLRERFMDNTQDLRELKSTIHELQKGEEAFSRESFARAENHFRDSIRKTPNDYPANVLLAKSLIAQNRQQEAQVYLDKAKAVYPEEAQAHNLSGINKISMNEFPGAYQDLARYDKLLPGNPNTLFLRGFAMEGMQDKRGAAQHYYDYLKVVREGKAAQHAYGRLRAWGYIS
ncbi:MAG: M48 family metalloprotease [Arenicellales bacterium]|nr:M48 family metalloprotease [Arenicellales bacterium]